MSQKTTFDSIEVKTPCSEDWNQMSGNSQVRFCSHCAKNVHDISAVTRKQAKKIVAESGGDLCVRYVRHPNGRIKTAEPGFANQKLHQINYRAARLAAGIVGATLTLASASYAQGNISINRKSVETVSQSKDKADKPPIETGNGAISGTVTDPQGALVPGVTVTLINTETGEQKSATTDETGFYRFDNLATAPHKIEFVSGGFKKHAVENVTANSGDATKLDAALEINGEMMTMGVMIFSGYTEPLVQAAYKNDLTAVKQLIAHNANVNARDETEAATALHVAVSNGNLEIVQLLLDHGARVNARDGLRRTPLMLIDDDANLELVQKLLDYRAKVNLADAGGDTVLTLAAAASVKPEILKLLLVHKARIDKQNDAGKTALMNAAESGELENVRALLEAGANPNLRDEDNETAWFYTENEKIEQLLIAFGAEVEQKDSTAAEEPESTEEKL